MDKKRINILMFLMNKSIGGTATYLFTLMKHIDRGCFNIEIVCNNREFCDLAQSQGFTAYDLEKSGRGRYLKAINCIYKLIKKNNIDILNIHDGGAVSFIGRIAAKIAGITTISTVHICAGEWGNRGYPSALKEKLFERVTNPLVKKYVAISHARKQDLIKSGVREDRISIIHNGIDYKQFRSNNKHNFRKEFSISENEILVAIVAHLGVEKGHIYFLDAAKKILKKYPHTRFAIVGDGYLRDELMQRSKTLQLEDHVIFTGFRKDIPNIMNSMDIFALSSTNEGLGLVIMEAMAASKPVVATNVGGIPEIVIDGKTGSLVPPACPQKMAEAVIYLIEDKEKAINMGKAGLERVINYFSAERMAEDFKRLFFSLLGS